MYRARTHYTILDDLPTFGRAHHLPTFRVMIDSALTALGCLLCALGAALDTIARRLDRAGAVLIGEIDPTSVHAPLIQWEGGTYSDHDTEVSLHLDPMADTEVSPALAERPVLAPLSGEWTYRRDKAIVTLPVPEEPAAVEPEPIPAPCAAQVTARKPRGKRCAICQAIKPRREFPTIRTEDGKHTRFCASCIDNPPPETPTVDSGASESQPDETPAAPEIVIPERSQTPGFQAVVNRRALLRALESVQRAVAKRTTAPILTSVKITARSNSLSILGYDTETAMAVDVAAEVDRPGSGLIPCRDLVKLLKASKDTSVGLAVDADGARVYFGESEASLPTYPVDEFPDPPPVPAESQAFEVDGKELIAALARTTFAADNNDTTRFALNGIYLEPQGDSCTVVATDSKRLAMATLPIVRTVLDRKEKSKIYRPTILIPAAAAEILRRCLPTGTVTVRWDYVYGVEFVAPGFRLHTRQVDGRYPPYRDIIGQTVKTADRKVTLPVKDFLGALTQAAAFTDKESKRVDFEFSPGKVTLTAQSDTTGSTSVPFDLPGCDVSAVVAFDPDYLADYLKALGSEPTTVLSLRDGEKPVIFQHNCESYRYLMMPLAG